MNDAPLMLLDDERPQPPPPSQEAQVRRHRSDSSDSRHLAPALASAVRTPAPAPPEWTPAWPITSSTSNSETGSLVPPRHVHQFEQLAQPRQQLLQEPIYAIRSASDISVGSEGNAVVNEAAFAAGELAVPRRIRGNPATDALGLDPRGINSLDASEVYGKATLMPTTVVVPANTGAAGNTTARRFPPPPTSATPVYVTESTRSPQLAGAVPFGRAQSGVYIHSLPSASEAEVPSSSSDSEEIARGDHYVPRPPPDPPGHVAKSVTIPITLYFP